MIEKRKNKRLDLTVSIQLERLDQNGVALQRSTDVNVIDISRSGMGFSSSQELEIGSYFDTKIKIWTKEIINVVIEIVRREEIDGGYRYGCIFIGMTDTDALKIDIYEIFNEA